MNWNCSSAVAWSKPEEFNLAKTEDETDKPFTEQIPANIDSNLIARRVATQCSEANIVKNSAQHSADLQSMFYISMVCSQGMVYLLWCGVESEEKPQRENFICCLPFPVLLFNNCFFLIHLNLCKKLSLAAGYQLSCVRSTSFIRRKTTILQWRRKWRCSNCSCRDDDCVGWYHWYHSHTLSI